ncbi:MAG: hypothetical protein EVJ46_03325 [Candidatus Acididesulfobacter guangdongensis]|uniref:Transposase IS200-like domain-containing protein n=1 Tax=Acididesulfobacter guangdongensis TaxID=2597225 RepID=A0A519BJL1_ACIG2|nr:MAG: hypothetical protein EVJ46_03325 [Candidatus Acididesulfobacter guangdongensis]
MDKSIEIRTGRHCVHLLINYLPKISISKLLNSLKRVSSRKLKNEFPEIKKH